MDFGTFSLVIIAITCVIAAILGAVTSLMNYASVEGKSEVQQQAVDHGYGRWEVYQGRNTFRWIYQNKP
jgi:hypothetical protein